MSSSLDLSTDSSAETRNRIVLAFACLVSVSCQLTSADNRPLVPIVSINSVKNSVMRLI